MSNNLQYQITRTFSDVTIVLAAFPGDAINQVPFEGSWTPAQVAEHMIKSLSRASALFNGPTEETKRNAAEKVKLIEDMFLNMETKFKSPDFILPGTDIHTKEELTGTFTILEKELLELSSLDLSLTCTKAEFPGFGYLTRNEWIHFYLAHTRRHTHQLKNILQVITGNTVAKNL